MSQQFSHRLVFSRRNALLKLAFLLLLLSASEIHAELRTVTTLEDTNDGVCNAHCSLREAVGVANDDDTVIFARPLRGGTIRLEETLVIEKTLKIDGPNRRRITLKGDKTFRILHIGGTNSVTINVSIDGLIIRDGAEPDGHGGGIYVDPGESLVLSNCLITDNHAAVGGGIRIDLLGSLELTNSTVSNNTSDGEQIVAGGAAGIDAFRPSRIWIINSTIAGNRGEDGTGGIMTFHVHPIVINSTITDNHSSGSGTGRVGGVSSYFGSAAIYNTIVAGNTGMIPDTQNSHGLNNFIGNGDGTIFIDGSDGNIVGTTKNPADPRLGPLSDNGGALQTHALLANSRAINTGSNNYFLDWLAYSRVLNADQRGFERFVNKTIDMGAVEYGGAAVPLTTTITGRIMNNDRAVSGAIVTVRNAGGEARTAITNPFGYYRITGLPVDTRFTAEVRIKRFTFLPQTLVTEETIEYVDFLAS